MAAAKVKNLVYPFNPNASDEKSYIKGEEHTITPANGKNYGIIIPRCAPFFRGASNDKFKLVVRNAETNKELVENKDYTLGYMYLGFSTLVYKGLYGCITFIGLSKPIRIKLDYATIGWNFVLDDKTYAETVARIMDNPRVISWEQVVDVPTEFPPIPHTHVATDTTDYAVYIQQMKLLQDVIVTAIGGYNDILKEHINATGDVHKLDKKAVSLDKLPNYQVGEAGQIETGGDKALATMELARKIAIKVMENNGGPTYRGPVAAKAMSAPVGRSWVSADQKLGGSYTLEHTFKGIPPQSLVARAFLKCIKNDSGYKVGDIVDANTYASISNGIVQYPSTIKALTEKEVIIEAPNEVNYGKTPSRFFPLIKRTELEYDMANPAVLKGDCWRVIVQITY